MAWIAAVETEVVIFSVLPFFVREALRGAPAVILLILTSLIRLSTRLVRALFVPLVLSILTSSILLFLVFSSNLIQIER
jgi:hypothetical protein